MEQPPSPLRSEWRLTPELFDRCVAIARYERAKAIAHLGASIARRARDLFGRSARRRQSLPGRTVAGPL
jgi:hypothetical protein